MKQFSIEIKDDSKVGFFIELMKSLNFVRVKELAPEFELSAEQKAELDKRYKEYMENPDKSSDWNDVKRNIEDRL